MTIHDIINPKNPFLTIVPGEVFGYNDLAMDNPVWSNNPRGWGAPDHNPAGPMPCHNPEHYINPLTGRYSSGPLDFR